MEVQNPGMLPFGMTMENLKAGVSKIRNRVIARVLREARPPLPLMTDCEGLTPLSFCFYKEYCL